MDSPFLDRSEVKSLTDKVHYATQAKALKAMGIEHRIRPDGSIAILRAHITKIFDGDPAAAKREKKPATPNWGAIHGNKHQAQ